MDVGTRSCKPLCSVSLQLQCVCACRHGTAELLTPESTLCSRVSAGRAVSCPAMAMWQCTVVLPAESRAVRMCKRDVYTSTRLCQSHLSTHILFGAPFLRSGIDVPECCSSAHTSASTQPARPARPTAGCDTSNRQYRLTHLLQLRHCARLRVLGSSSIFFCRTDSILDGRTHIHAHT